MAKTGAIRAGRAYVELFADDSKLIRGLKAAQQRLQSFGSFVAKAGAGMTAAGAAITTPFVAAAKSFSDVGDKIQKTSIRTGIAAETLSRLGFAAEQSGSSFDAVAKGVAKMQRSLVDGTADFEAMGLSQEQLLKLNPEQQFVTIAEAISRIEDPTRKAAAAMEVFGRGGVDLLPLLNEGAAGIGNLTAEADRLGLTMDKDTADSAAALTDATNRLNRAMGAVWITIGEAVAPALTQFYNVSAKLIASGGEWVRNNQELLRQVFMLGVGLGVAGTAVTAVGGAIILLGAAFGAAATVLTTFGAVLGAILSPVGLAVGLLGAAGAYAFYSAGAVEWLTEKFGPLGTIARETFSGISNAMTNGDIGAAADVLWATLEYAWVAGTGTLMEYWYTFTDSIKNAFTEAMTAILNLWETAQSNLAQGFVQIMGWFDDSIDVGEAVLQLQGELDAKLQANNGARDAAIKGRTDNRSQKLQEIKERMKLVEAQRQTAVTQANTSRTPDIPSLPGVTTPDLSSFLNGAMATANKSFSPAAGTFSSLAGRSLVGADDPVKKQLKAAEKTNDLLRDVKDLLEETLSFA